MMRTHSGFICALTATIAFAFSCADSGTEEPGDDMNDDQTSQNVCGDGTCAASEVGFCSQDCGSGGNNSAATCGDGMCETTKGENGASCASDCGGGSGSGSGSGSSTTCPSDPLECVLCGLDAQFCVPPLDQATCAACGGGFGSGSGGFGDIGCTGMAPDGTCDANEDATLCPSDCQ